MNSFTHLVRSEPGEESRGGVGSVEWVIRGTWREDDVCWDYNWHWDNCDDYKNCSDWEGALEPTHDLATNARSTAIPPPPPHTNHKYEEIPGLTKKLYTCQSQHSTVFGCFPSVVNWNEVCFSTSNLEKENPTHNILVCVYNKTNVSPNNKWLIYSFRHKISPSLFIRNFLHPIFEPFRLV